jgi:hypothetical protein
MCEFDCLLPPTARAVGAVAAAEGEQVARFRYAQTKIDRAPDTILVDTEVVAIIEEQQQAVRARFPGTAFRYLFSRRLDNQRGDKPVHRRVYGRSLQRFSELVDIRDSKGRGCPGYLRHASGCRRNPGILPAMTDTGGERPYDNWAKYRSAWWTQYFTGELAHFWPSQLDQYEPDDRGYRWISRSGVFDIAATESEHRELHTAVAAYVWGVGFKSRMSIRWLVRAFTAKVVGS